MQRLLCEALGLVASTRALQAHPGARGRLGHINRNNDMDQQRIQAFE